MIGRVIESDFRTCVSMIELEHFIAITVCSSFILHNLAYVVIGGLKVIIYSRGHASSVEVVLNILIARDTFVASKAGLAQVSHVVSVRITIAVLSTKGKCKEDIILS